ncbi:amino acid transporter [Psychromicrobium silvestre]|uniref:Amino acid transporter n=1 Tax=Psychromicrobium silvestre TaxID=1645614 RepID=A0A7Y9LSE4_9MICC|nr:APC family permease [Psychromicrobium silvestre]NYE94749.1 amino acid transporter [Psychromicrobium silvestre]
MTISTGSASPSSGTEPGGTLARNSLGVAGIVFLVLAAVAPLTGIVVIATLGIALGNGGGMPVSFLIVTVILLLFAVGYAQMSKQLVSAGGFYAFVLKGLGRPAAIIAGYIALLGYNCFVAGAVGTSGFFTASVLKDLTGWDTPWILWSLVSAVAVFLLSRRGIDVSAKILGVCLVLEVTILLVFDLRVLSSTGFSFEVFAPEVVFSGSAALGLLFAANVFIGFEATGLFSEEARKPLTTIPRATFVAISFIGVFAALTSWAIVSATGVKAAQGAALDHLATGDLVFSLAHDYLGDALTKTMMVLLLVSLFAALLALHNSTTRYLFAFGRVGILPRSLGRTRGNSGVPQLASLVQICFAVAVALLYFVLGLDPIAALTASMTGLGTLGILTLQLLAAVAIVVSFRRQGDRRIWRTLVAPGLGALGLFGIVFLVVQNFGLVAGSDSALVALLPLLLPLLAIAGAVASWWLRRHRPELYAQLNRDLDRVAESRVAEDPAADSAAEQPLS